MPGSSSIEVPPFSIPALCQESPWSVLSILNPIVAPFETVAGFPSIGSVIQKLVPLKFSHFGLILKIHLKELY